MVAFMPLCQIRGEKSVLAHLCSHRATAESVTNTVPAVNDAHDAPLCIF